MLKNLKNQITHSFNTFKLFISVTINENLKTLDSHTNKEISFNEMVKQLINNYLGRYKK